MWGALCWGLAAEDLPEQYRDAWRSMAELYDELDERATAFYEELPPGADSSTEYESFSTATPRKSAGG